MRQKLGSRPSLRLVPAALALLFASPGNALAAGKTFFAKVDASGQIITARGATAARRTSAGDYEVTFKRTIENCVFVATIKALPPNDFYGFITAYAPSEKTVRVAIRDAAGTFTDAEFHLAVVC